METNTSGIPYNPAAVAITGGTSKWDDGAAATPSIAFAAATGTGWYRTSGGSLAGAVGGACVWRVDSAGNAVCAGALYLGASAADLSGVDSNISKVSTGVHLISSSVPSEWRVGNTAGGYIANVKSVTESLTIAAAATTVGATSIPAGAILLGVAVRVTTVIPTAATFTVTTTVGGTVLNTAAVSAAANSTDQGTAAGASYRAAATTVTITPNATPGAATGVVRLQYYYIQVSPPTS